MANGVGAGEEPLDERFRRALDSILDLVVVERAIRDERGEIVDFEIVWMNNAPVDVAGRPRAEMIGRRISELYPALAGGELIAGYRRVVETTEPLVVPVLPYEDVIEGRAVSGFYTVQASKFEDGVLVASRDITPLETARLDLESALRELETAQRLARLGTWHVDLGAGTTRMSDEMQRIFGLPAETVGQTEMAGLASLIHPGDVERVQDANEQVMRTGSSVVVEHRVIRSDGGVAHVRTYTEPVVVSGEVVGLWGTTQDISDIIASQTALRAEHARRVSAEVLAELASRLNRASGSQAIADAVHETTKGMWNLAAVVLGLVEPEEPVLRLSYAATGLADSIRARYMRTPLAVDTHMTRPVNTARPLWLDDRASQRKAFPALMADVDTLAAESFAAIPLVRASGEVFGALGIAWTQQREFDDTTKVVLDEVVELVARATERMELRQLERSVAQALQLGLLALDCRTTTVIVRARYRASDTTMEIGGDWYDAVLLDDGRLALTVGDVVGRGLPAATTMGQLRAALAITALQAKDATDAIEILDKYAERVRGAKCATVAFAIVDPAAATVSHASAGHPPPLLVMPDGSSRYLEAGRSWPLAIDVHRSRTSAASDSMPPGALLLLYTDGLVERRGEPLDVGLARLQAVVTQNWNLPLRRLKQAIFRALIDDRLDGATDDIALLAARSTGSSPTLFVDAFHADPSSTGSARRRLRRWLDQTEIDTDRKEGFLVAIGEAIANAIDHGSAHDASQIVKLEIAARDNQLIASVSDSGQWQPGVDGYFSGRGRGHLLMQSFTDDVDIDTDPQGTIVTLCLGY
jgi:PAS domain S-box-containing protein